MALAPPARQTDRERRRFFDGFQTRFPELALRWGNTFARWRDVPGTELVVSHYITNHSIGVFVRGQRGVPCIETAAQLRNVHAAGYTEAQGFLIARPMPAEQVRKLLDGEDDSMPFAPMARSAG